VRRQHVPARVAGGEIVTPLDDWREAETRAWVAKSVTGCILAYQAATEGKGRGWRYSIPFLAEVAKVESVAKCLEAEGFPAVVRISRCWCDDCEKLPKDERGIAGVSIVIGGTS